jgi:peroxiredoxin
MESSSRNTNFQTDLKNINFKTFFRSQIEIFDYDDLFAEQRVVVFSIPKMFMPESLDYIKEFNKNYEQLCRNGIDRVYAINSFDRIFPAWMDHQSQKIIGLSDIDHKFIGPLARMFQPTEDLDGLSKYWQYIAVFNNGILEKFWKSPYKSSFTLRVLKRPDLQYHKLGPEVILDYIKNSVDSSS